MGTTISGVVVSLLRIATKATLPATEAGLRASVVVYFALAAAVTAASKLPLWGGGQASSRQTARR